MKAGRRSVFNKIGLALGGVFGLGAVQAATRETGERSEKVVRSIETHQDVPLFSGSTTHNGLVFIAGKGAHFDGDIKAHTKHVLDSLENELIKAGSSMDKVLKVNVYLHDLNDYTGMNEEYRGRFGKNPPVRTTIATYGGVPGDSLVEIDCIATT